ncbi:hypothetical protein LINPERPRIM_LOCUS24493 [Linum perenne]
MRQIRYPPTKHKHLPRRSRHSRPSAAGFLCLVGARRADHRIIPENPPRGEPAASEAGRQHVSHLPVGLRAEGDATDDSRVQPLLPRRVYRRVAENERHVSTVPAHAGVVRGQHSLPFVFVFVYVVVCALYSVVEGLILGVCNFVGC